MSRSRKRPDDVQAALERVVGIVNGGMLSLMVSVGHRTGLFDAMAGLPPSTSAAIAEAAGLQERYVREWLGAMVTGGLVAYEPGGDGGTYALPEAHAAVLTRDAGVLNLAPLAQQVAMLALVEDDVAACFRDGGGVPYSRYPAFQRLMAEESAQVFDAGLVDVILPIVPGLVDRLDAGIDVLDVGCGSGHAVNLMAAAFPNSRFVGYDFSDEGIAAATAEAAAHGLTNARFEVEDVSTLAGPPAFDFVTAFDAIHDQARPDAVLRGIAESLRDDGVFLCVDIRASSNLEENVGHPLGPFVYTVSTMHCMTVSLALDGAGLGTAWGEQLAVSMLHDAGFAHVDVERVDLDPVNNYYVARKAVPATAT